MGTIVILLFQTFQFLSKVSAKWTRTAWKKTLPGFPEAGQLPLLLCRWWGFPLFVDLMRPYPRGQRGTKLAKDKLVFNYRLSRAHHFVECAFGVLVQCFWVFDRRVYLSDGNATIVTKACTVPHNYLTPQCTDYDRIMGYLNPEGRQYNENKWTLRNIVNNHGYHSPTDATLIRDWYKAYFWSATGALPYQMEKISDI